MWFLKMRVDLLKERTNCGMEQLKMETLSQTALIFIPFLLPWITRRWIVRLRNVRCGRMDLFRFLGSNNFILRDRIRYFNQLSTFLAVAWVGFNQLQMIKLVYFSSFVFKNTKFFYSPSLDMRYAGRQRFGLQLFCHHFYFTSR